MILIEFQISRLPLPQTISEKFWQFLSRRNLDWNRKSSCRRTDPCWRCQRRIMSHNLWLLQIKKIDLKTEHCYLTLPSLFLNFKYWKLKLRNFYIWFDLVIICEKKSLITKLFWFFRNFDERKYVHNTVKYPSIRL